MGVTSYLTWEGEILSETRSGVESDYLPDPLGSTSALLNSSQVKTDTFSWWPYGEQRSHLGTSTTSFGYLGTLGYYKTSGGIYNQTRSLRPDFTSWNVVSLLWPSQFSYAYVRGRPTVLVDDTGVRPQKKSVTSKSSAADRLSLAESNDCSAVTDLFLSLSSGSLGKYRDCMAGSGCPDLDRYTLQCLNLNLCNNFATVSLEKTWDVSDPLCGHSVWYPIWGCPSISLFPDQLDDPGCNHFGANAPYHIVLLHEALHTCGINHGKVTGDKACNNRMACCILRATGFLKPWQRCR